MPLIRETRSTANLDELYPPEAQKLRCGSRHFNEALRVDYKLVSSADELPGGTEIK